MPVSSTQSRYSSQRLLAPARSVPVWILLLTLAAVPVCEAAEVTSADEICPPDADPCVVTGVVDIASGSTLDFHSRTLQVRNAGQLNFGSGTATVRCGRVDLSTAGAGILARRIDDFGDYVGARVEMRAERQCSSGTSTARCIFDSDCQLGACDARRCSGSPSHLCTSDADCQLGACGANHRCANRSTMRCASDSDCDFGTCPAQLTCHDSPIDVVSCSSDADCTFGSCSVGDGSILLDGAVLGDSRSQAALTLRAANSVTLTKVVALNAVDWIEADGGDLTIETGAGNITVGAGVYARGTRYGQGGNVFLQAANDLVVRGPLDVSGGLWDGGSITGSAGRDIHLANSMLASSRAEGGRGGEISFQAGRDALVDGEASGGRARLDSNGSSDSYGSSANGGDMAIEAGGDLTITSGVRLGANGSAPEGYGADIFLSSGDNLRLDGDVSVRSRGALGGGGSLTLLAGGTTQVGATTYLDLRGGFDGAGLLEVDSDGDLTFAGTADLRGRTGGGGGWAFLVSQARNTFAGYLQVRGADNLGATPVEVEGCRVTLQPGSRIRNDAPHGASRIIAHKSMDLMAGSQMATGHGTNTLVYRSALRPPTVVGLVSPAPELRLDESLTVCAVCGDAELDDGEECDDGNVEAGDGCSAACMIE